LNTSLRKVNTTLAFMATLAALATQPAAAAPRAVEPFDTTTWSALQAGLKQPTVVVFSTTDCAHCPAVIDSLAQRIRGRQLRANLLAVVMDVAPGEDDAALLKHPHYGRAHRVLAFSGQAPALRHSVNPQWRGITPYVVFLAPGQAPQAVTGPPSDGTVQAWARSSGPQR
jgi:hypothetical protein